jgi:hypothetical protein
LKIDQKKLQDSLYQKLQNYILDQAISGKRLCDVFEKEGYSRKAVSSLTRDLYKRLKIERTRFKTKEGHIYGKTLLKCLEYGINEKLLPRNIISFFKILIKKGFITNQQLIYEYGFEMNDLNWIWKKLIKFHYFNEKTVIENRLSVFYCPGSNPEKYKKTDEFKKWFKWSKNWTERIKDEGSSFEETVEKIYQKLGFQTTRNRWYRTDQGSFEVDIVAWKEEPLGIRTIYISCKKYFHSIITSYDLLRMVAFRKSIKNDYGEVHIWGWDKVAQSIWQNIPAFPFVRLFFKPDILKMCQELKIDPPGYMMKKMIRI